MISEVLEGAVARLVGFSSPDVQLWCGVWHIGRDASLRVVHNPKARPHMHYQKIQELNKTNVNTKANALSQAARYAEWDRPDRIEVYISRVVSVAALPPQVRPRTPYIILLYLPTSFLPDGERKEGG